MFKLSWCITEVILSDKSAKYRFSERLVMLRSTTANTKTSSDKIVTNSALIEIVIFGWHFRILARCTIEVDKTRTKRRQETCSINSRYYLLSELTYTVHLNQSYGFVWSAPYVTKSESELPMDHCQWRGVYTQLKRCVLTAVLKVSKLTESRTAAGMLFQTAGAETAKECLWKSEEAWGRCKTVQPECNALDDWWRCSSLAR